MTQGYRIQFLRKPPTSVSPLVVTQVHSEHRAVLLSEISTLLEKKAIREVPPGDRQVGFYSRYFLIPKKDGNLRPILDLRGLNRFIRPLRCKMLTVSRVRQFICRGDWFVTIDLKDAYFQIPIWKGHWRFLRFVFNGKVYEFQVLPFGISLAPRTFTRCMEAVLSPLRQEGIRILNYLDDWLLCAGTQQECRAHLSLLLEHLRQLGLRLNYEKSHLVPSQETHFLGLVLNSQAASLTLSQARLMSFESCLSQFRLGARVTWRQCLRLMGLMASMSQAVPLALLNMRPVQRYLLGLGLDPQRHLHVSVLVTRRFLLTLRWWRCAENVNKGLTLGPVIHRHLVATDASLTGWGAVYRGNGVSGHWRGAYTTQHINVLELRAIYLALRHFLPHIQGQHVLVRTDSVTAASYVNRQGGLGSVCLCKIAHQLWLWAQPKFLSLRAVHVPGLDNVAADLLSRGGPDPGSWRLHPQVVWAIWGRYGQASVDLFASRQNAHCPLFFSLGRDNPPLGVDAMSHPWPHGLLYAFPPFGLLPSLLQRVRVEEVRVVLVAPLWPHMTWFSDIPCLLNGTPWELPVRPDLLSQGLGALFHPFPRGLRLWAWPLRGPSC
ncbi:unnamed protein product [Knipowitschia caucasica]